MRVHLQHPLSKQVCFLADLWQDIAAHYGNGHRPCAMKGKAKKIQKSPCSRLFLRAGSRVLCLKESKEQHWRNAYTVSSSRLRDGNEYVQEAPELLPVLCGVGSFGQLCRTLSQQECMEIMHGEKGNHLCGTAVTRERDFRNRLLL